MDYFSHKNSTKLYVKLFFTSGSPTWESILGNDVLEKQSVLIKKLFINLSTSLTNNKVLWHIAVKETVS